jgi:hypothetical protein
MTLAAMFLGINLLGATPLFAVDNLVDHGGLVLTTPKLYIIYWGVDWHNGFNDATSGLPSSTYRAYLEDFLDGVGGGDWLGTQLQYRNAGSPQGVLKGVWEDSVNPVPATPTQGQIEDEVRRAVHTFNNESEYPEAVYIIALPPGHGDTLFTTKGGPACAWHSTAWNQNIIDVKLFPYITLPYMPDAGSGCATNSVNGGFDFSGHGIFDGVSKVVGHEWAETLTDPIPPIPILSSGGWIDDVWNNLNKDGGETGDKCNSGGFGNIGAGGDFFAVQRLWSNNDGGCVLAGAPSADQSPASYDFGAVVRYNSSSALTVQLTNNGDIDLPLVFINGTPWYFTGPNANDFWLLYNSNTCGKILHPGASCHVEVHFRPTDFGTRQAILGANIPLGLNNTGNVTPLTGDGISQWALFDQNSVVFQGIFIQPGGVSPSPIPLNLTNQGDTPRLIQNVMLGGFNPSEFSILSDGCSDHELGPSESCTVVLDFTPTATGERQAELQFTDATGTVFGLPVLGTGLGPVAQLSADNLDFEGIKYDSAGAPVGGGIPVSGEVQQNLTLTNIGQSPLQVNGAEVTGDFALDFNGCTQSLQPTDSCTIQVRLTPTQFEYQSGSLLIYDNSSDSPHEVKLSGSVDAAMASLASDEVRFGSVPVGSTSDPQMVFLENLEGGAPLDIQSIAATGDFTATSDCPSELAIGRCTITVTLKPTAAGTRNGMLVVTDNAPNSPQQIPLVGTGVSTGIDLVMTAVTPNAPTVNAGATLSVTDTVSNQGLTPSGAFRIAYHLSTDAVYGNADDVATSTVRVVTSLAAGASNTATTSLMIPATTPGGTYYLCAMADSVKQVVETNETNNSLCSSIQITVPPPDLVLGSLRTGATTVAKRTSFPISFTIRNRGGSPAGSFVTGFHLSSDANYGGADDIPVKPTLSLPGLGAGAGYSNGAFPLVVPKTTPSGTYYVCGMTDTGDTVAESDESNNTRCTGTTITVTP